MHFQCVQYLMYTICLYNSGYWSVFIYSIQVYNLHYENGNKLGNMLKTSLSNDGNSGYKRKLTCCDKMLRELLNHLQYVYRMQPTRIWLKSSTFVIYIYIYIYIYIESLKTSGQFNKATTSVFHKADPCFHKFTQI